MTENGATHKATYWATHQAALREQGMSASEAVQEAQAALSPAGGASYSYASNDAYQKALGQAALSVGGPKVKAFARNWNIAYQGGAMWPAFKASLRGYREVLGLDLPAFEKGQIWVDCMEGGMRVLHEDFCVVTDHPEFIKIDDERRAHCEDGPSHRWRDGWSLYHWHGVAIPEEWMTTPGALAPEVALEQRDTDLRSAACEILGWAAILQGLSAKTIDEHSDPMIGKLVSVDLPEAPESVFLIVECGTKREFAIPVPRDTRTALEAQAAIHNLPMDEFIIPEVRT